MEYVIRKEQHGFTVRLEMAKGGIGKLWAYSSVDEALAGVKELLTQEAEQ